jgi:hypothetical protein
MSWQGDAAADAWIIEARKAQTSGEVAATLKEFSGYYVLRCQVRNSTLTSKKPTLR